MSSQRPFVIWFQHRSGSTHLVSLLNSHRDVRCKGEIFGCFPIGQGTESQGRESTKIERDLSSDRILGDQLYRRVINQFPGRIESPSDSRCVEELDRFFYEQDSPNADGRLRGFKLKFPSQVKLFPEIASKLIASADNTNLIVLHRHDYLRRAISVINLQRLQSATDKANVTKPLHLPPAAFDPVEVARLAQYYQTIQAEFDSWAKPFPNCFQLDYADLLDSKQIKLTELQDFLGLKFQPLKSSTHKVTPDDLAAHVTNLQEIYSEFERRGILYAPRDAR